MRILLISIVVSIMVFPMQAAAYAKCDTGFERCERLKTQEKFYERCMDLMCAKSIKAQQPSNSTKKSKPVSKKKAPKASEKSSKKPKREFNMAASESCNSGLRRCDKLRVRPKVYWQCMEDTCTNVNMRESSLRCSSGVKACKRYSDEFGTCLKLNCRHKNPTVENCSSAKNLCSSAINEYWDCMAQTCVGNIDAYLQDKPFNEEEEKMLKGDLRYDFKGDVIRPELGVHSSKRYPPKGVRAEDWNVITPPERMYVGNPGNTLVCPLTLLGDAVRLTCLTRDIKSCHCGDGTTPILKPVFKKTEKEPDPKEFTPEKWQEFQSKMNAMAYAMPTGGGKSADEAGKRQFMRMVKVFEKETGLDFMSFVEGWGMDAYKHLKSSAEKSERGQ